MSVRKFKFVSPGVFVNEIDNSQRTATPELVGPIVIGRTERGPAMRPVQVDSFSDFVEVFGNPIPGGMGGDVWRDGNYTSPTYAPYAAQAWLRNNTPCTVVRLLGSEHPDATAGGKAGWQTTDTTPSGDEAAAGGAFGLFLINSASNNTISDQSGTLAAVFYLNEGSIAMSGTKSDTAPGVAVAAADTTASAAQLLHAATGASEYRVEIRNAAGARQELVTLDFSETSEKYIRKVLNTNPTLTNGDLVSSTKTYWLGETFERQVAEQITGSNSLGVILGLGSSAKNLAGSLRQGAQKGSTGWTIAQDLGDAGGYNPNDMQKLFRFHTLNDGGEWECQNLKVSISNIRASTNTFVPHGTFDVLVRKAQDSDGAIEVVERFSSCNLNPSSPNYLAKKVGDRYAAWDVSERRYREYGKNDNNSKFIRVEMNSDVDAAITNPTLLPYGFHGPIRFKGFTAYGSYASPCALPVTSQGSHAVGTIEFTSTMLNDRTITIISTDGTSKMYVKKAAQDLTTDPCQFSGSSIAAMATSLALCIADPEGGHNGKITTSDNGAGVLTLTQAVRGLAGNTTMVDGTDDNITLTQFAGGTDSDKSDDFAAAYVLGNRNIPRGANAAHFISASVGWTGSFSFPSVSQRTASLDASLGSAKDVYWGIDTGKTATNSRFNVGYKDLVRSLGSNVSTDNAETSWIFSLDDLKRVGTAEAAWVSGSRAGSNSFTSGSWKQVLTEGYNKFTMCLSGGFDGLDVTEKDPFRNEQWSAVTPTETTNYAFHSVKRAIDCVRDPEVVECNLMVLPGITQTGLTDHLLNVCEDRGDALAILDLEGGYVPAHENNSSEVTRAGSVSTTVTNLEARAINSSYGCAYYPWVQIRDTINGASLWAPPSIVALGTMASSERKSELWFAPAGFTRGGLTVGSAGVPVVGVNQRLTSKERDDLYEANINPIASFPAEGIVIFGQKTLQVTPSALDRINVRRLMIFVKKEISRIAATLLFDQNVGRTWNRFIGRAEPLLRSIQTRLGLTDFKIALDETTTTPDLVDRNIMYAKIFLKPARAIEFIAIDFVITDSGASFED